MKQRKPLTPEAAQIRAEELCARAEHSAGEIRDKLRRQGIATADAEAIIARLIKNRFIDDARFARAYVRDKVEFARWGRRKIALGLYQKRVDRSVATEALDEIDPDRYADILRSVLDAKRRTIADANTYEGRTRLFRFAISRGYEPDLVARIIRESRE